MELTRRGFLKLSGASSAGFILFKGVDWKKALSTSSIPIHKRIGETTTICCYCGVGCGAIVAADEDQVVNLEGDPDHPINEGTLCPKGQAMSQARTVDGKDNEKRITKPLYRAAGASKWQEISWGTALGQIAAKIKSTRDDNWKNTVKVGDVDYAVNRTDAIANFGGGELDNEECYLLAKMARALGIVYLEHCARI